MVQLLSVFSYIYMYINIHVSNATHVCCCFNTIEQARSIMPQQKTDSSHTTANVFQKMDRADVKLCT